jgi:hypothetical protein
MRLLANWTPSNWRALDNSDQDLGSSEPLPLPGGLLFAAGKDGFGRLVSADALKARGQVFSAAACGSGGAFGASLYRAGVIYVPCSGGLVALTLSLTPSPRFSRKPGFSAPPGASGPPIFAGGLVWSTGWRSTGILYGLDPANGSVRFQTTLGSFDHFATPSAGGGRLFVAVGANVTALKISSFPPPSTTTPAKPKLSSVRLGSSRFTARRGTSLELTLSETATLRVQVSRTLSGRRIGRGRCRVGAKRGTRCSVEHRARRLQFDGRRGRSRLKLSLRGLPSGSYAATILARDAGGRTSKALTIRFVILSPRR